MYKKYMRDRIEFLSNHNFIDIQWLHDADIVHSIALNIYEQANNFNAHKDTFSGAEMAKSFSKMMDIEKNYLPSVLNELELNNAN